MTDTPEDTTTVYKVLYEYVEYCALALRCAVAWRGFGAHLIARASTRQPTVEGEGVSFATRDRSAALFDRVELLPSLCLAERRVESSRMASNLFNLLKKLNNEY